MPVFSIIVPVYKVEQYLSDCLDSILAQEEVTDWEAILVDDGSPDRSGRICDEYAAKDGRFRVIHQANRGLPGARNAGLEIAQGEYILFLDSDDSIVSNALYLLSSELKKEPDVLIFCCRHIDPVGNIIEFPLKYEITDKMSGLTYLDAVFSAGDVPNVASWLHMYKKSFLAKHQLRFKEEQWFREDLEFYWRMISVAETVTTLNQVIYNYRALRAGSLTASNSPEKVYISLNLAVDGYRQFPRKPLAEFYCGQILSLAWISPKKNAGKILSLLDENRDILHRPLGWRETMMRAAYTLFGFYYGSKVMVAVISFRHKIMCCLGMKNS